MKTIFGALVRIVLMLAGLVFLASLLAAALLVLAVWLLRAGWARLTGKPVQPWTFQVNRQAVWSRFYRPPGAGDSSSPRRPDDADVIDVEPREIKNLR